MPSVIDQGMGTIGGLRHQGANDPYIRVGNVLNFIRGQFPGMLHQYVPVRVEPQGRDVCRILPAQSVRQFWLDADPAWASYADIVAGFKKRREAGLPGHGVKFPADTVFSPLRVVLEDHDEPIRAALTTQVVYPMRGRLGNLKANVAPVWLYVAVGVMNSVYGQAFYRLHMSTEFGTKHSPWGVNSEALHRIPLVRRDQLEVSYEHLESVAYQVHQLTIHHSEVLRAGGYPGEYQDARERLKAVISLLLALDETDERKLIDSIADLKVIDTSQPNMVEPRPDFSTLPPVGASGSAPLDRRWLWTEPETWALDSRRRNLLQEYTTYYNLRPEDTEMIGSSIRLQDPEQPALSDQEWRGRMEALRERVKRKIPKDATPAQIGADVEAACDEVRREHGARRR